MPFDHAQCIGFSCSSFCSNAPALWVCILTAASLSLPSSLYPWTYSASLRSIRLSHAPFHRGADKSQRAIPHTAGDTSAVFRWRHFGNNICQHDVVGGILRWPPMSLPLHILLLRNAGGNCDLCLVNNVWQRWWDSHSCDCIILCYIIYYVILYILYIIYYIIYYVNIYYILYYILQYIIYFIFYVYNIYYIYYIQYVIYNNII